MTQASDLTNDPIRSDTTEIAIIRMEGAMERGFDRVSSEIGHLSKSVDVIRQRQHDQGNDIHSLLMLNLPEKLTDILARLEKHSVRIDALESGEDQRKGMVKMVNVLWAILGLLGIEGLISIARLLGGHA